MAKISSRGILIFSDSHTGIHLLVVSKRDIQKQLKTLLQSRPNQIRLKGHATKERLQLLRKCKELRTSHRPNARSSIDSRQSPDKPLGIDDNSYASWISSYRFPTLTGSSSECHMPDLSLDTGVGLGFIISTDALGLAYETSMNLLQTHKLEAPWQFSALFSTADVHASEAPTTGQDYIPPNTARTTMPISTSEDKSSSLKYAPELGEPDL